MLRAKDDQDRVIGSARCGLYAFYDFDGEPIYVGQTYERLSGRVRRHLTNQRTDSVAMHVLDPMEVAEIELWPLWDLQHASRAERIEILNRGESTVYKKLAAEAKVSKLLNEKAPADKESIELPASYRARIIPDDIYERLRHKDERIARRAATIANLAQVVRERNVSIGLRQTLVTQSERLQLLATERLQELIEQTPPEQLAQELQRNGEEAEQGE